MIKKLIRYFKNYRKAAILSPVLMFVEVICDVVMPFLMAKIVDVGIANGNIRYISLMGGLMILSALIALVTGAYASRLASYAAHGAGTELRADLFNKIQSFSFANLDKFSVPSLITRLTTDINNLQQTGMMCLRMLVRAPFMMVFAFSFAVAINRQLSTVFLVAIPVLGLGFAFIMTAAHPRFKKLQEKIDEINNAVQENLINVRVVKSFVREDHEKGKFKKANDSLMKTAIHAVRLVIFGMPMMQLVMYGCILAILWFGGQSVMGGTMLTGELMSFISYVMQILMSLMMLSMLFLSFTRAKASGDRVVEVLETDVDLVEKQDAIQTVPDGGIRMQDVRFRYATGSGEDTLSGVNFEIAPGEIIGVIGATGAAKTTLVQLIPRLYDTIDGDVFVGGVNVRDYALKPLRDAVAMVLQKNTLFSGTIRDNLKWGDDSADDQTIQKACEAAQAWEFISGMPNGLDTDLGQGGVNLSGGQKQRLCIARALLKNPKILILDDSTSAVDMATDARIREAFRTQLGGVTTIIIAQRVRSIEHADRIIVLDNGHINAIGTHDELLLSNEIYRDVYESQQEGALAG